MCGNTERGSIKGLSKEGKSGIRERWGHRKRGKFQSLLPAAFLSVIKMSVKRAYSTVSACPTEERIEASKSDFLKRNCYKA